MDMLKMMKQLGSLKAIQKDIEAAVIRESFGGIDIEMTGAGKVLSINISEELYSKGRREIEKAVKDVFTRCSDRQHKIHKEKASQALGGMKIPGILD